ncbi:N-acetylmuramoyl-L-alanine amidase [Hominimerdicola sp. 21CYCFAH17_S]
MANISDEEFERLYGRPPVRTARKKRKIYWNRIIIAAFIFILIIFGIFQMIKSIINHFKKEDNIPAAAQTDSVLESDTQSTAESQVKVSELQFKVCIDPGHGDTDGGTANADNTRLEKDDNLRIALLVRKYLEEYGATVVMTRSDDTFVELEERCTIANDAKADMYVSLHRNSYDGDIRGVEIWVHNKEPKEDTVLAQNIMSRLSEAGISENRGVQYGYVGIPGDNYYVNADTKMPSCLVELGFITDETDNRLFDKNIDAYAKAVAEGIIQSAKDLGVIDDDGTRLLNQQLISKDKEYDSSLTDSTGSGENSASDFPPGGHLYNQGEQQNYNR